jgi:hypothetical protein
MGRNLCCDQSDLHSFVSCCHRPPDFELPSAFHSPYFHQVSSKYPFQGHHLSTAWEQFRLRLIALEVCLTFKETAGAQLLASSENTIYPALTESRSTLHVSYYPSPIRHLIAESKEYGRRLLSITCFNPPLRPLSAVPCLFATTESCSSALSTPSSRVSPRKSATGWTQAILQRGLWPNKETKLATCAAGRSSVAFAKASTRSASPHPRT